MKEVFGRAIVQARIQASETAVLKVTVKEHPAKLIGEGLKRLDELLAKVDKEHGKQSDTYNDLVEIKNMFLRLRELSADGSFEIATSFANVRFPALYSKLLDHSIATLTQQERKLPYELARDFAELIQGHVAPPVYQAARAKVELTQLPKVMADERAKADVFAKSIGTMRELFDRMKVEKRLTISDEEIANFDRSSKRLLDLANDRVVILDESITFLREGKNSEALALLANITNGDFLYLPRLRRILLRLMTLLRTKQDCQQLSISKGP